MAKHSLRDIFRWLLPVYVRPHVGGFLIIFLCILLASGAAGGVVFLVKPALDSMFSTNVPPRFSIGEVALAILACALAGGVARYVQTILLERIGYRINHALRQDVLSHVFHSDLATLNQSHASKLTTRCLNETSAVRDWLLNITVTNVQDVITFLVLLGVMIHHDWRLTVASLTLVPVLAIAMGSLSRKSRHIFDRLLENSANLSGRIADIISNIRMVKIYGAEDFESGRVGKSYEDLADLRIGLLRTRALIIPLNELVMAGAIILTMLAGAWRAQSGDFTLPALSSFLVALVSAYRPLKRMTGAGHSFQEGLTAARRVYELLSDHPKIRDGNTALHLAANGGEIRFEDVWFSYDGTTPCLSGVSLTVPAGAKVAIVGSSGAGKSTLVNMIPRFFDPQQGRLLIDGTDIRSASLASLRSNIAMVTQETLLFDDSVAANITYGLNNISQEQIAAAAQAASAGFIANLPQGYDTLIGERGIRLSGGQRQRIAIARALLKDARILLLDEATSSLDNVSEAEIKTALDRLSQGRTTIIVAHRLSTIVDADRIFVLDKGRVVESGSHAELLAAGGVYAHLFHAQAAAG